MKTPALFCIAIHSASALRSHHGTSRCSCHNNAFCLRSWQAIVSFLNLPKKTPLVGQAYADVLNEFLPEGVLQIVHGADDQGKALVASDINLVAFTGSREVGAKILTACGPDLKRVVLELGGKDALIVLEDADIDAAASFAVQNSFRNSGQVCVSTERIYVDSTIADDFENLVVEKNKRVETRRSNGRNSENRSNGQQHATRHRAHAT